MHLPEHILARAIPRSLKQHPELVRRARIALLLQASGTAVVLAFAVISLVAGSTTTTAAMLSVLAASVIVPIVLRRTGSLVIVGHLASGIWMTALSAIAFLPGGVGMSALVAAAAVPLIALLLAGRGAAVMWIGVLGVVASVYGYAASAGYPLPDNHAGDVPTAVPLVGAVLLSVCLLEICLVYESTNAETRAEWEQAERARRKADEDAQAARAAHLASLGQLAAGVAHEVNNPLSYVMANIDYCRTLVEQSSLSPKQREDLLVAMFEASEGAERVQRIVSDLKTFAREPSGERKRTSVVPALEVSLKMVAAETRHRARIVREFEPAPEVDADPHRLSQVFVNLLLNACHAIDDGHADEHRITIRVRPEDDAVTVSVTDTGRGIEPELLGRVFDPFFTTKPVGIGTGLGLSVCRNIVEDHDGRLEIQSEVGSGTTVTVRLPAVPVRRRTEDTNPRGQNEHMSPPEPAAARVLIIDDDPMVRRSVERTLHSHIVTSAECGRAALDLLRAGATFDLILCDLMMPDLTGMDVYEQALQLDPKLARRFVFITGGAFTARARDFLNKTENALVTKPFSSESLRAYANSSVRGSIPSRASVS